MSVRVGRWATTTVAEVRERLADKLAIRPCCTVPDSASTRYVEAHAGGRRALATTAVQREGAGRNALRRLVDKVFQGSPELLNETMLVPTRSEPGLLGWLEPRLKPRRSAPQGGAQVIAVWMLYCLGIGLAFSSWDTRSTVDYTSAGPRDAVGVGYRDRGLIPGSGGRLVASPKHSHIWQPIPVVAESRPGLPTSEPLQPRSKPPPSAFSLADLDRPLRWAWYDRITRADLFVGVGARRLIALRPALAAPANVDGRNVLILAHCGSRCGRCVGAQRRARRMGHWTFFSIACNDVSQQ